MAEKSVFSMRYKNAEFYLLMLGLLLGTELSFCEDSLMESLYSFRADNDTIPEVTTPLGTLVGSTMLSRRNRTIFSFRRIPFAQPPIGDLRFRAPRPATAWNGTWDASYDSEPCPQISYTGTIIGDEDCLYLNVYTPELPSNDSSTSLPVMVFIVGGGFIAGITTPDVYSPTFLLDKDVIFVTPNFRMGALGYLTTGDEVSPGNYGLKDIVCALQWVQDNIEYFGGDPNQVTLAGASSGGMSVHLLSLSKATEGLFHRYITEGGSALVLDFKRPRETQVNLTLQLGEYFGCPTNTSTLVVNCLREIDAWQFVVSFPIFFEWKTYPTMVWFPTYEPDIEEALFTDFPANILAAGNIRDLPWISLVTRDEGFALTADYFTDPDLFEDFLSDIDNYLPWTLGYIHVVNDVESFTAALKSYYFNDLNANRSLLLANLTQLQGDILHYYPTYDSNRQHLAVAKSPQYFSCFEYRGTFSYSYYYTGTTDYPHVVHSDEIIYLFGHQGDRLKPPGDDEFSETDWLMVDNMVQLWTSFMINGTPTTLDSDSTIWEPYTSQRNYLRIGDSSEAVLEMEYDLYLERMQFWDELMYGNLAATVESGGFRNVLEFQLIVLCLCLFLYIF